MRRYGATRYESYLPVAQCGLPRHKENWDVPRRQVSPDRVARGGCAEKLGVKIPGSTRNFETEETVRYSDTDRPKGRKPLRETELLAGRLQFVVIGKP